MSDTSLQGIITAKEQDPIAHSQYAWQQQKLTKKGKLVVGNDIDLKYRLLTLFHDSTIGGHSGVTVTAKKLASVVYWKGLWKDVRNYVRNCSTCQKYKLQNIATPGLLQRLPIPEGIFINIIMDFIEGLPKSQGKSVIFVVVDRLTKYAHFTRLSHPFLVQTVAQAFFNSIYKLHGMPYTITSDRGSTFISKFWRELFKLQRVELQLSIAYHPQTDGQTEVVNRCLETYLQCMVGDIPHT